MKADAKTRAETRAFVEAYEAAETAALRERTERAEAVAENAEFRARFWREEAGLRKEELLLADTSVSTLTRERDEWQKKAERAAIETAGAEGGKAALEALLEEAADELDEARARGERAVEVVRQCHAYFKERESLDNIAGYAACPECLSVFAGFRAHAENCDIGNTMDACAAILADTPVPDRLAAERWQDISTAPRDGTPILVCDAPNNSIRWAVWAGGLWRDGTVEARGQMCGVPCPTHWMPLPEAPALRDTPAEGGQTDE